MSYGTIKVDTITFTDNSVDKSVSLSGLIQNPTFTGNITVTGTISGDVIRGGTTVSGATVTGTTANFVSGVFTTQISGATVTGTTASFTSGVFTNISGTTATITSGIIASGTDAAPSLAILADLDTGLFSPGANQLAVATNGTGRLFVDASGNIGINTTPSSLGTSVTTLEVKGGSTARSGGLRVSSSDSSVKGAFYIYDGAGVLGTESATPLDLYTGNSPRLSITAAGLVGIGTSTVSRSLHIAQANSTAYSSSDFEQDYQILRLNNTTDDGSVGLEFQVGTNGQAAITADEVTDGNTDICFGTRGSGARTEKVRITAGGLVGIGTTGPSGRLDVETASDTYVNFSTTNNGSAAGICLLGNNNDEFFGYANSLRFATVTGKNAAGFNERMRMDSSGRLLVGTSSSTGLLSNTAPVIAGLFKSFDDAATFTTGVAQTLFTIPNTDATYIITLRRGAVGDVTNYQAVSILSANATPGGSVTTVLTALKTAGNVSISISGTNLQGTQTSGGAASLQWVVTRVG